MAHQYVRALEAASDETTRRYVVLSGAPEQVIAHGALWRFRPDGYRINMVVAPGWRRRGVGSRLLAQLDHDARAAGAITLQARAGDDWTESLTFLRARGFVETMRMHRLVLDVGAATLEPYRRIEPRLAATGILITTLERAEVVDPRCWQRFRDLHHAAQDGWADPDPRPEPDPAWTTEEFRRRYLDAAAYHGVGPDECFLAVHADRYVGFTGALGTAVHPEYRDRGIATALKVRAVDLARARDVAMLATSSGNPAMLRVNERLGFRRTSTEVRLVKRLT